MPKDPKYVPLRHPLRAIDVEDLPEPLAIVINSMVQALRRQLATIDRHEKTPRPLLTKPGTVLGKITRSEIYDDVV